LRVATFAEAMGKWAIAAWEGRLRGAGPVLGWGMAGIVGLVCLGLDRPDLRDEAEGRADSAALVGFEDGSAARVWWWELAWPAECLAGRVGECRSVGARLVGRLADGYRAGLSAGEYQVGPAWSWAVDDIRVD
jgi:hypothetical protein